MSSTKPEYLWLNGVLYVLKVVTYIVGHRVCTYKYTGCTMDNAPPELTQEEARRYLQLVYRLETT